MTVIGNGAGKGTEVPKFNRCHIDYGQYISHSLCSLNPNQKSCIDNSFGEILPQNHTHRIITYTMSDQQITKLQKLLKHMIGLCEHRYNPRSYVHSAASE